MDDKILKFAKEHSANPERLYDNAEQYPICWLLKEVTAISYPNNLGMIKGSILCMDKDGNNFQNSSDDVKVLVDELLENEKIVDIVLITVFQWLGTNVGFHMVEKLLDDIKKQRWR